MYIFGENSCREFLGNLLSVLRGTYQAHAHLEGKVDMYGELKLLKQRKMFSFQMVGGTL